MAPPEASLFELSGSGAFLLLVVGGALVGVGLLAYVVGRLEHYIKQKRRRREFAQNLRRAKEQGDRSKLHDSDGDFYL